MFDAQTMILEDDIVFQEGFLKELHLLREELSRLQLDWDLIYLDRKNMSGRYEPWVGHINKYDIF